jgi:hypothetical protein
MDNGKRGGEEIWKLKKKMENGVDGKMVPIGLCTVSGKRMKRKERNERKARKGGRGRNGK